MSRAVLLAALTAMLTCSAAPSPAQPPPDVTDDEALAALLDEMGAPMELQLMFRLMAIEDLDPMLMMMLMGAMDGGMRGGMGEVLMVSQMMGGGLMGAGQAAAPATVVHEGALFIIEEGVATKINTETMEVEGRVQYRGDRKAARAEALAQLVPLIQGMMAGVAADARASAAAADVKILNTASAIYQAHTDQPPATQNDLVQDNGVLGWDGPYIEEIAVPPEGWAYAVDADGHWTATGP